MTLSSIRSLVRSHMTRVRNDARHLGVHSDYTDKELDIWINQTYKEFCGDTELLSKSVTLTYTDGVARLPDDLIDIKIVSYDDSPIGSINRYSLEVHPEA